MISIDGTTYSVAHKTSSKPTPGPFNGLARTKASSSSTRGTHLSDFGPGDCAVMPDCHTAPFSLGFARELAVPRYWIFGQPREGNGPCGRETICSARHLR